MEKDILHGVRYDLALWLKFLSYAMNGIAINLIVFQKSTFWSCLDACEWDLGGYNNLGMAWRMELPDWMIGIFTINFLEFLTNIITH
eukprot:11095456-Ditylum_brightwellii.AAC.1